MAKKLVYGVGVNDADYIVNPKLNRKQVYCRFYRAWVDMLNRCYNPKCQAKHPTYIGCIVCDEWLTFSNFKAWMEKQDWHGKELDKDILFQDNKIYSPDTCVFITKATNLFTTSRQSNRGLYPIGVYFYKPLGKFKAQCCNPFANKKEALGYFDCQHEAHQAWKKRKHELALQLADLQTDRRVADALRARYQ